MPCAAVACSLWAAAAALRRDSPSGGNRGSSRSELQGQRDAHGVQVLQQEEAAQVADTRWADSDSLPNFARELRRLGESLVGGRSQGRASVV